MTGRIVPNSYQKPNLYTDKLMRFLSGDEWKTLDVALRKTFGWNVDSARISISQFMNGNGRLDEAGDPVEYGTGCSRAAQIEAINELMRFGILIELAPNDARKRGRKFRLQLDEAGVRFDLLAERHEAQKANSRKRTAAARQAAHTPTGPVETVIGLSDRPVDGLGAPVCVADRYRSVQQTDVGLSSRPIPVCVADPKKPIGNPLETQPETQTGGAGAARPIVEAWRALVKLCEGDESQAAAVWKLQEEFAAVTRLRRPDPATDGGRAKLAAEWWPHLRQVLDDAGGNLEAAERAMGEAVRSMDERETPLTVVGPRSIVNVTASVLAAQRRKRDAAASQALAVRQRPKGMSGIDAYLERRGLDT